MSVGGQTGKVDAAHREDVDAYVQTGLRGALGVYRNQDRIVRNNPELVCGGVKQLALFIGGDAITSSIWEIYDSRLLWSIGVHSILV